MPGALWSSARARTPAHSLELTGSGAHFKNFIDAVRAHDRRVLTGEVLEGHLSTSLCHLSNIAYRVGRTVVFDSERENFIGDSEADRLVSRAYRKPFVVPKEV